MTAGTAALLSLACYQRRAVEAIRDMVGAVSERHMRSPSDRRQIARELGVLLLQAPTGSGKTLILGRALEEVRGRLDERTVWFWFAPYSGLVAQTRAALAAQCGSLRLRDLHTDRDPTSARDGDVFVQTWASVAATNKEARKVRRDKEDTFSLDTMLEALRDLGFRIGVVIDEAHLNFGVGASAARAFYLDVLSPDFTILATATPNDAKLEKFEKDAGLRVESRVVIGREEVVRAGLNKVGLMVGVLSFREEDRDLIDEEAATLTAGWSQHSFIKSRLHEKDIAVTPLMLVQVEDQAQGQEDPVTRVRQKLVEIGVPESAVAVHTSGEPDPDFHTLAYDPEIEVLIFKVAVATGFDAPRAWTLVSVRPSRGREFGLQIVGRIMRVDPAIRPFHGTDPLLDRGYVFLSDPASQIGLDAAAEELKAVREGIEVLTDRLDVNVLGSAEGVAGLAEAASVMPPVQQSNRVQVRHSRMDQQIGLGMLEPGFRSAPQDQQDRLLTALERLSETTTPPLFPNLPSTPTPGLDARAAPSPEHPARYPLRADLGLPAALVREELPNLYEIEADLCPEIAREFCRQVDMVRMLTLEFSNADLSMRDLFDATHVEGRSVSVRMSPARIAERAQMELQFNDGIDPRRLRRAIEEELSRICSREGVNATPIALRRAINLAILRRPQNLREAVRVAQGRHVRLAANEPIPAEVFGPRGATPAKKGAYGAFVGNYNRPERAFAEWIDRDDTGIVRWWLRNPENVGWATRLVLPTGRRFFPDFVVGIKGRKTKDEIALVEIKDDGETGRLQSDSNAVKIRTEHKEYRRVFWTYREEDGVFVRAIWNDTYNRIFGGGPFEVGDMVTL